MSLNFVNQINQDFLNIADLGMALGFGDFTNGKIDVASTYPKEWQRLYSSRNWIIDDPIIPLGLKTRGPARWPTMDPNENEFSQAARDFGLHNGFIVSSHIGGNRCIAGLATSQMPTDIEMSTAQADVVAWHFKQLEERTKNLTSEQKDLLCLFALGYRGKEVAVEFGISEDAVKQRKLSIQRAIGVTNFATVIYLAGRVCLDFT